MYRIHSYMLVIVSLISLVAAESDYPPARPGLVPADHLQQELAAIADRPFDAPRAWICFQVDSVSPGTQAARLGIVQGDQLVALDDHVFGLFSYIDLLKSFRSSTEEQILHWETADGKRRLGAIQPGRVGIDMSRRSVYEGIAGIGSDAPSAAMRLAAQRCIDDPPLAESALALALRSDEPPTPAAAWIVYTIARFYAGDLQTCVDRLLDDDLPGAVEDWRRLAPMALKAATRLGRADLVDALLQRWPAVFLHATFTTAAETLPRRPDAIPLWQRAHRFVPRRPNWPQKPKRFTQATNNVWQDGQVTVKPGLDQYYRLILQAPDRDLTAASGLRFCFDLRVKARKGKYRYPGQLWMHVDTDGGGGTDFFWSTYGADHMPGLITKLRRHDDDPLAVPLPRPATDRRDRWHHLECWMHDRRMECYLDGLLILATELRHPIQQPQFILHIQSAVGEIRNLQWYQFDLRETAPEEND